MARMTFDRIEHLVRELGVKLSNDVSEKWNKTGHTFLVDEFKDRRRGKKRKTVTKAYGKKAVKRQNMCAFCT